jgi:hypothetical protein
VRLRCGLRRVTIAPRGRSAGHVVARGGIRGEIGATLTPRQREKVERLLVCSLARAAADVLFSDEQDHVSYGSDFDDVANLVVVLGLPRAEWRDLLDRMLDRATVLVEENEAAIRSVANALIRQTTLSATQVRSIIAAVDATSGT